MSDGFLSDAAKNAGRIEVETKTRTEYRDKTIMEKRTERRKREARGIWENIRGFFGKDYYEYVDVSVPKNIREPYEVTYTVTHEIYDVEKFKAEIAREQQRRISRALDDAHDIMEKSINLEIENIFVDVKRQCTEIGDSFKQLYIDFAEDISLASDETNRHRAALERDISTFNAIKAKLQSFFDMWDEILHGDAKG